MATCTGLRLFYLFHFSKPATDRRIYRAVYRRRVQKIVELGVGPGQRAVRLIQIASRRFSSEQVAYTGIDPFETRRPEDGPGITLKQAHQLLYTTGARVRLVPGDPLAVFSAMANNLGVADLVLINWPLDRCHWPRAMYYLERMIHDGSLVLLESPSEPAKPKSVKILSPQRIHALAATFPRAA